MHTDSHRRLWETWLAQSEPQPARSARFHQADTNRDDRHLPKRDQNWLKQFQAAETYWLRHHNLPREKSSVPEEASAAGWLRRQRSNVDHNRLCLYQIDLLNTLPFEWNPRNQHQTQRHHDYVQFVERHGRPPRRRSSDPVERALARWTLRK